MNVRWENVLDVKYISSFQFIDLLKTTTLRSNSNLLIIHIHNLRRVLFQCISFVVALVCLVNSYQLYRRTNLYSILVYLSFLITYLFWLLLLIRNKLSLHHFIFALSISFNLIQFSGIKISHISIKFLCLGKTLIAVQGTLFFLAYGDHAFKAIDKVCVSALCKSNQM